MAKKVKVLIITANPVDAKFPARLHKELREINNKIRNGLKKDFFEFAYEFAMTPGALQQALLTHQPHILHFSGHGTKRKGLMLEDDSGRTVLLDKQAFTRLLRGVKDNLQMIILNACYSSDQAQALKEIVDYTIGMKKPILDESAITFASYFYQAIAFGRSVDNAFELALAQLDLNQMRGSDVPELLVQEGVDSSGSWLPKSKSQKNGEAKVKDKKNTRGSTQPINKATLVNKNSTVNISDRGKQVAQEITDSNAQGKQGGK
jgi:CHAT domain